MADSFSFDVVSDFDRQELVNALDQVLDPAERAKTNSNFSSSDCYRECVEAERQRCNKDCDSSSPWNPCNSLCYIAISTGCLIGCTG